MPQTIDMLLFLVSSEHWLVKYHSLLVRPPAIPISLTPKFCCSTRWERAAQPVGIKSVISASLPSRRLQVLLQHHRRPRFPPFPFASSLCSLAPYSHLAPPSLRLHFFPFPNQELLLLYTSA